jgi:DNA gyrase/topoisomerase IV subunit B
MAQVNTKKTEYGADNIKVLSDLEHIRLRRGMYIGEANDPHSLLSEIFDNAIDEVQAGFSKELIVYVDTKTNTYTVRDFGRGIPHGKKTLENGQQKEVLEVLMTVANSGGKFDNNSYNYSSGLNGVGMTVTNALSNLFEITSYRKGKFVKATAHGTVDIDLEYGTDKTQPDGTNVTFNPNGEYFHSPKIPHDFILDRCKVASALGFRARLIVDGKEIDTNASIYDLIKEEEKVSTYVQMPTFDVVSSTEERMKIALTYISETNDRYAGYTNLLNNSLGGTHVNELGKCISNTWQTFLDKHKKLDISVDLKPNDYLVGLRGVIAVFISKPEFSSQTKEKLVVNKKYFEELMGLFSKKLYKWLEDNIDIAQQLLKRFEEYRVAQNNLLNRKEISSLIKVNTDDGDNIRRRSVVSKLIECTSRKKEGTELIIVEGDSAKGPYMFTRNKETQAILPLRGKVLNVTFKNVKDAIKNKEICDIANSIGCGIGGACDAKKSRYERIIISADADKDGLHINCLVLSVFVNMFPDLVKQGMVYISMPPLFCWGSDPKTFGWCNDIKDIPPHIKDFHRFKGLGEMNQDQLEYFLVNPKTRNVMQVEYPSDIDLFNSILGTSEGKNNLMKELGVIVSE